MANIHKNLQNYYYVRGLVQSPCGKINVIMTLTFYPPPPLNVIHFRQDSTLKSLNLNDRNSVCACASMSVQLCALLL